jgi:hypothetical protein
LGFGSRSTSISYLTAGHTLYTGRARAIEHFEHGRQRSEQFISMSGHLLLAIASSTFSLFRLIGSHSAITACIINDPFLHTLNALHLVVEVTFEFPALGQQRKNDTLATASCLIYNISIGPASCPCSWHSGIFANFRSDLRDMLPCHVNFLFCTRDASPTYSRQATIDTTHIFRLEHVL